MKPANTLRCILLAGAASLVLAACSDTDISSPGVTELPPPPPPPPPPPAGADLDLVPDGFDDSSPNLAIVEITAGDGSTVEMVQVSGTIESDLTFQEGVGYYVDSQVFIGADAGTSTAGTSPSGASPSQLDGEGVTATFEPGVVIYGDGPESGIIVNRGANINANGTADAPIVFTSFAELQRQQGLAPADPNARAEWVGLVLNGFAPINNCNVDGVEPGTAECEDDGEASSGLYGGGDPDDSSGILNYVRVEHAGVFFNEEDQSNGIAFQGVGAGTTVSNIQVHNNGDDGIEFFGGTVSATNVVLTGTSDDAVDWTDGWTGSLQRVLVLTSEDDGDYAIEADNRSTSAPDTQPRSFPRISNFTFIGNGDNDGIRLREGTAVVLANGIVANFDEGLKFGDVPTADLLLEGPSSVDGAETIIASHLFNNEVAVAPIVDDKDTDDEADDEVLLTAEAIAAGLQDVLTDTPLASTDFIPGPEVGAIPVFDVNQFDGLTNLGFIGAFSPSETVDDNWAAGWTKPGSVFAEDATPASCPESLAPGDYTVEQDGRIGEKIVCAISGVVTRDLTLGNGDEILYRLDGQVFVGEDGGPAATNEAGTDQATLTIDAGVTVFGDAATDGLVVTRGSRIEAVGTADNPIVMTSGPAVRGLNDYATASAQWLGLSINGKAPINKCDIDTFVVDGEPVCQDDGEASSGVFGGNVPADDSGTLEYVRVEFAGIFFNEEDQSNGIAFQGVGSGTDINFIQVHNNGDDGIEFFGGTANAKNVVITGAADDAVDWTDGWQGNIQYLIVEQKPGDDYGFEGDNRSTSAPNTQPRSTPQVSNFTIIGADADTNGARFREGMGGAFVNGIIADTAFGIDVDQEADEPTGGTFDLLSGVTVDDGATLVLESMLISSDPAFKDDSTSDDPEDVPETFTAADVEALTENVDTGADSLMGFSFYGKDSIGVVPGLNEANVTVFDVSALGDFFEAVTYIGAVEGENDTWYLGWTVDSEGNVTSVPASQ